MIDTVLLANPNEYDRFFKLLDTTFYDQEMILREYTNDEFSEKVKTLKIFRLIDGDTIYYGGSRNYCLNRVNWKLIYGEDYTYAGYDYFLELGKEN